MEFQWGRGVKTHVCMEYMGSSRGCQPDAGAPPEPAQGQQRASVVRTERPESVQSYSSLPLKLTHVVGATISMENHVIQNIAKCKVIKYCFFLSNHKKLVLHFRMYFENQRIIQLT